MRYLDLIGNLSFLLVIPKFSKKMCEIIYPSAPNTLLGLVFRYPFNPLQNHLQQGLEHKGYEITLNDLKIKVFIPWNSPQDWLTHANLMEIPMGQHVQFNYSFPETPMADGFIVSFVVTWAHQFFFNKQNIAGPKMWPRIQE